MSIAEAYAQAEDYFSRHGFVKGDPAGPLGRSVHGEYARMVAVKRSTLEKRRSAGDAVNGLPSTLGSPTSKGHHRRHASADESFTPSAASTSALGLGGGS